MDQRRWLAFIAATTVVYVLFYILYLLPYQKRLEEYRSEHPELYGGDTTTTPTLTTAPPPQLLADTARTTAALPAESVRATSPTGEAPETSITVHTRIYRVVLTNRGGRPVSWQYLDVLPSGGAVKAIEMIPQRPETPLRELPLEVIVKELNKIDYPEFNTGIYTHEVRALDDGTTEVVFTSPKIANLQVVKTYRFSAASYLTGFQVVLRNLSPQADCRINDNEQGLGLAWGPGVRQFAPGEDPHLNFVNTIYGTPRRAGYAAAKEPTPKHERIERGDIRWAGVTDKFFLAVMIPDGFQATAVHCLQRLKNALTDAEKAAGGPPYSPPFTVVLYGDKFELPPQGEKAFDYQIFVGPKQPALLREASRQTGANLSEVLFYFSMFRWMRALKLGLMYSLNFLHSVVHNYGVAIVILTILIRAIMHPLAHKGMKIQAKTMAEMKKIKPLLDEVNRKYKNDATKRNQEMMRLYKEHNISPFAPLRGCLPMFVQLPIFFALYSLLNESIDLRGASFLWIQDLAGPDRLVDLARHGLAFSIPLLGTVSGINLLPILMGLSQYYMSKLTPTPSQDPAQKQMMLIFTIMFPVMLYNFPSGLFIYWLINNVWQSAHQLIANRIIKKPPEGQAAPATTGAPGGVK